MADYIDGEVTGPVLRNGRLYFKATDSAFFPADSFGDRGGKNKKHGRSVDIQAGADTYSTDIRASSDVRISPRRSFAGYLKSARASEGMTARLHRLAPRQYRLELLP